MWWPRSNQALMFVQVGALHTCVRTAYGQTWRALDPMPLDAKTPTALRAAIETQLRAIKPSAFELALSWDWAPGLVVDFGTAQMPRAARDALARLRVQESFGSDAARWTVIVDGRRYHGPRSVFGASPEVIDAARAAARACGVRLHRIEPAFTWSWRAFEDRSLQSCWWIVDHGHALTAVQVRNGTPHSIDHLHVEDSGTTSELELTIARLAIRRAVTDASTLPMHWVLSGGVLRSEIPARAIVKHLHAPSPTNERAA